MIQKVKIISDTCSSLEVKEAEKLGITINPLYVNLNNQMFLDTVEISTKEFYDRVEKEKLTPTTSQPNLEIVRNNYLKYKDYDIINITPSAGLSGTYNGAVLAKEGMDNVTVFDAKTIASGQRYLVLKAHELAKQGLDKDQIIEELTKSSKESNAYMIPIDPMFLLRGGRLTKTAALMLNLLRIKPIVTLSEDRNRVDRFALAITLKSAVETSLKNMIKEKVDETHMIYILHANNMKAAEMAYELVRGKFPNNDIEILTLPPVLGCHAGPGTIVVQHIKK